MLGRLYHYSLYLADDFLSINAVITTGKVEFLYFNYYLEFPVYHNEFAGFYLIQQIVLMCIGDCNCPG